MYAKDIAARYEIDQKDLESFILNSDLKYKASLLYGVEVFEDAQLVINKYREYCRIREERENQKKAEEKKKKELAKQLKARKEEKEKQLDEMIATSTSVLQGYNVIDYCGMVYSTEKIDNPGTSVEMHLILKNATNDLKNKAISLGANALIGLNISTTKVDFRTILIVYGTAVKIAKEKKETESSNV